MHMAEPTPEDEITLNFVVEGDDIRTQLFEITVCLRNKFTRVRDVIQQVYWTKRQISIYDLILYKANLSLEQSRHAQLSDETLLWLTRRVASGWSSQLDVDEDLLHIIVRPTSRHIINTHMTITPSLPRTEFEQFIQKFEIDRSKFVQSVQAKKTSSAVVALPHNFLEQQGDNDFINIGSPVDKARLSIVLYHEVFGRFIRGLRSSHLHSEVYRHTEQHSPVPHLDQVEPGNPQAKDDLTQASLCYLSGDTLQRIKTNGAEADGVIAGTNLAYLLIMEISTGLDPKVYFSYKNGTLVDLIFTVTAGNPAAHPPHPMHKHGVKAWLLGSGTGAFPYATIDEAVKAGYDGINVKNPPLRDDFPTPADPTGQAWMAVRYRAVDPGPVILHCHIDPHLATGMVIVLLEGAEKLSNNLIPSYYISKNKP
ncbi:multicopper oxidase, partial [Rhizoctonia solani AG-3 Rhs1AP]